MSEHTPGPWKIRPHWHDLYITANSRVGLVEVCKVGLQSEQEANAALIARAPELQAQLTAAQQRVTGLVDHVKHLETEVAELRAIKFRRFNNEDCWIYQGDGEDHLESLVCPVVMSAQQVMEFEKAQQRVVELERENTELKRSLARSRSSCILCQSIGACSFRGFLAAYDE